VATLRAMTEADLDAVMAVEVCAYAHPWSRGNFVDTLRAGHPAWLRLAADGSVAGYAIVLPAAQEIHLLNLTVAPALQRQGHARALLDALVDNGRARGADAVWLEVRASNRRARTLYERYGFETVGTRRRYYPAGNGEREDAILMTLVIEPIRVLAGEPDVAQPTAPSARALSGPPRRGADAA
jgi:ribosomal-protein-alanine N-acetyltransferase